MSSRTVIPISAHPQIGKIDETPITGSTRSPSPIPTDFGASTVSGSIGPSLSQK